MHPIRFQPDKENNNLRAVPEKLLAIKRIIGTRPFGGRPTAGQPASLSGKVH
jgi:hypothetical protein